MEPESWFTRAQIGRFRGAMQKLNMDATDVAEKASVNRSTVSRILNGHYKSAPKPETLNALIRALRCDFMADPETLPPDVEKELPEQYVGKPLDAPHLAPNGLRYRVWKLEHKHLSSILRRAKQYDLRHVHEEDETALPQIMRHARVCDALHSAKRVARCLDIQETIRGMWWVLDSWIEGQTLDRHLEEAKEPIPFGGVVKIMAQIAEGLGELHAAGVFRRGLAPENIYVAGANPLRDPGVILTDFEMAKITNRDSTVIPPKDKDRYAKHAPEFVNPYDKPSPEADIYSWGMIFAWALLRPWEQDSGGDFDHDTAMKALVKPKKHESLLAVAPLLKRCLDPIQNNRPKSSEELIEGLRKLGKN